MTDHQEVTTHLRDLIPAYLGKHFEFAAQIRDSQVSYRPGPPSAVTRSRQHYLGLDHDRVLFAWSTLGQRGFADSILVEATETGKGILGAPLYRVVGVRQRQQTAAVRTAYLIRASDGVAIVADTEAEAVARRKLYDKLVFEDWSTVDLDDRGHFDLRVTNARVVRAPDHHLVVELEGVAEATPRKPVAGVLRMLTRKRQITVRFVRTDDGTWYPTSAGYSLYEALRLYEAEKNSREEIAGTPPVTPVIADEDAAALADLAF